jgi:uncharacterized membrane protein YcaP (DUF421 family)
VAEEELGIGWERGGLVVVATVAIYMLLVLSVRLLGQRTLATMSSFDLGCAIALGAVVGRTSLLRDPTLGAGVIAMTTLFATQIALARLRQHRWIDRLLNRPPVLLMVDGIALTENMRASHLAEDELRQKLRLAGVRTPEEVQCAIMERNGSVSVIRRGEPLHPELYSDVPDFPRSKGG